MIQEKCEDSLAIRETADPCVLVIFGIAGDLTKRLLFPAICNLGSAGLLHESFSIVGVSKEKWTTHSFATQLKKNIETFVHDPAAKAYGLSLVERVTYISGEFADQELFVKLSHTLENISHKGGSRNYLFYFATPPQCVRELASGLSKAQLLDEKDEQSSRRIIVEKPFGYDYPSAKALNAYLLELVKEHQIFRIDHFLGKETVQNLLTFRFSNGFLEPLWNYRYIDHVQITVAETLGVELRGGYYDPTGALRDMVPNHIFQVLSLIAMEPPVTFSANDISAEKAKVMHAIQKITPEQVLTHAVRGQYNAGTIGDEKCIAYRSEAHVDPASHTETYAAMKLFMDNWRWLNVPFYIRTGKRMKAHTSEIVIHFNSGPANLFGGPCHHGKPNILCIRIQPEEGISIRFNAKIPGPQISLGQVNMRFQYSDYFGIKTQTGYETILYDCMNGDHLLFPQADSIETSWAWVQPILDVWGALPPRNFPNYTAGSWGPADADKLIEEDGRSWFLM